MSVFLLENTFSFFFHSAMCSCGSRGKSVKFLSSVGERWGGWANNAWVLGFGWYIWYSELYSQDKNSFNDLTNTLMLFPLALLGYIMAARHCLSVEHIAWAPF